MLRLIKNDNGTHSLIGHTNEAVVIPEYDQLDVASKVDIGAFNSTGSAPQYVARAWVNFSGAGIVAIRDSGNISSITDLGTGTYRANFSISMPSVDYSWAGGGGHGGGDANGYNVAPKLIQADLFEFYTPYQNMATYDPNYCCVIIHI